MSNREWLEKDFYAILGVGKDASEAEIKKAYRTLALRHHPDANHGDARAEERFKGIAQAFEVLSKTAERSRYDRLRAFMPMAVVRPAGFEKYAGSFFVPRPVYRPPVRGSDLETGVILSVKEARRGVTVSVEAAELGRATRTVIVRVPPGVVDGQRLRIPGRGGYGSNGGQPGDLFVTARIFSSQVLSRNPKLNAARAGRNHPPVTLRTLPRVARMIAHFLLNPNDVELNEALSRYDDESSGIWAKEIIRERRAARR